MNKRYDVVYKGNRVYGFCVFLYLEHGEGEGVSELLMGGQQHFAVVSIQIHAGQQVQFGIHPVQTPVRQV